MSKSHYCNLHWGKKHAFLGLRPKLWAKFLSYMWIFHFKHYDLKKKSLNNYVFFYENILVGWWVRYLGPSPEKKVFLHLPFNISQHFSFSVSAERRKRWADWAYPARQEGAVSLTGASRCQPLESSLVLQETSQDQGERQLMTHLIIPKWHPIVWFRKLWNHGYVLLILINFWFHHKCKNDDKRDDDVDDYVNTIGIIVNTTQMVLMIVLENLMTNVHHCPFLMMRMKGQCCKFRQELFT